MKTMILTLAIGGRGLPKKCRESQEAAAERWGCEYHIQREKLLPGSHMWWEKAAACASMSGPVRILYLDGDVMIRHDAPSPFELVPEENVGVVTLRQFAGTRGLAGWQMSGPKKCASLLRLKPPGHLSRCLNGGFILWSLPAHRDLIEEMLAISQFKLGGKGWPTDQCLLSVLLNNGRAPTTWLPHTWNIVAAGSPHRADIHHPGSHHMCGYVYHFVGARGKQGIPNVEWRGIPPKSALEGRSLEIVRRLPKGPCQMAEVGVYEGTNAERVLEGHSQVTMHLVDPWTPHPNPDPREAYSQWLPDDWKVISGQAFQRLGRFWGRWSISMLESERAARSWEDRELDLVFIDGDHREGAVSKDIQAWTPKIKLGGWIGGHDYRLRKGVRDAVTKSSLKAEQGVGDTWWARVVV